MGGCCSPSSGIPHISSGSFWGWWSIANVCCFVGLEWEIPSMPTVRVICIWPSFPSYTLAERRVCPVSLPPLWEQWGKTIMKTKSGVNGRGECWGKMNWRYTALSHVIQKLPFFFLVLERRNRAFCLLFSLLWQEFAYVDKVLADLNVKPWHDLFEKDKRKRTTFFITHDHDHVYQLLYSLSDEGH